MANVTPLMSAKPSSNTAYAVGLNLTTVAPEPASLAQASTGLTDAQLDDILELVVDLRRAMVAAGIIAS